MIPAPATSLIPADNAFALLAVFFAIAVIGASLEKTKIGRRVSGVMFVIALAIMLSHFDIIPASAPTYDLIWTYLVPLAIALFLLRADLVSIVVEGGRTLVAFLFGAVVQQAFAGDSASNSFEVTGAADWESLGQILQQH